MTQRLLVGVAFAATLFGCDGAVSSRCATIGDAGPATDAAIERDAARDVIAPSLDAGVVVAEPDASVAPPTGTDSVDAVIDDMRGAPTTWARPNNESSVIFSGNAEQAQRLSPTWGGAIDDVTSWCWIFATPENAATHAAVQVRHSDVYVLRASTGRWEVIGSGRPSGWRGNLHGATFELQDEVVLDEDTLEVRPGAEPRPDLLTYELWPTSRRPIDVWTDVRAVYATCQARVVALPDAPEGDLERAHYAAQIGFDLWRRAGGAFDPGVTQFDGSVGRMRALTTEWQSVHVISLAPRDPTYSMLPGYLGFGPDWTVVNPFLDPPYTLTEEEIRANPPPLR